MASPGHVPLAETPRQTWVPLPRCSCFAWTPQRPPTNCTAYFLTTSSTFQPPILHIGNPSCIVASFKGQGLGEELLQNTGGNRAFTHKKHVHTESLVLSLPSTLLWAHTLLPAAPRTAHVPFIPCHVLNVSSHSWIRLHNGSSLQEELSLVPFSPYYGSHRWLPVKVKWFWS